MIPVGQGKSVLPGLETLPASDPKQEGSAVQRPLHDASHFHYSRNPQLASETHGLQTPDEAVQAAHAESASSAYSEHRQSNESGTPHAEVSEQQIPPVLGQRPKVFPTQVEHSCD